MPPRNQPRALPDDLLLPRSERPEPRYTGSAEPLLLAERARQATFSGTCALCPFPVTPGERVARLVSAGKVVHVACAARAPGMAR
jgi:hypothetical protein